jgi:hypothetical protein
MAFSEFAAQIDCSMSLWVGCQATSTQAVSDAPVGHSGVQLAKGLGSFRYRHQWFAGSYLCHILPLHGRVAFPRPLILCPVISRPGPVSLFFSLTSSQATTMADQMAFLLFGDQSLTIHDCLADFLIGANYGVLCNSFLEKTACALQKELECLSSIDRRRIPAFATIQDLNERYHAGTRKNAALDSALLCVTQLALYIE